MPYPRLLLIDDDVLLMRRLATYLQENGYTPQVAHTIGAAQKVLLETLPDIVVLDWNLPDGDGLSQLAKWRAAGIGIPVLMLSGNVSTNHKVGGLRGGADDYLTKPFDVHELVARIDALLRRSNPMHRTSTPRLRFGPYMFDIDAARLTSNGKPVSLAVGELQLLMTLCKNANRVLSREKLLELIGDLDGERLDRSIDLRVARLRERIGDDARSPNWIITVRGQGYRLDAQVLSERMDA